jgi:hypothetical protein
MKPLVLYHGGCFDGFCAAWVFDKYGPDLRSVGGAEFVPVQYGQDLAVA